MYVNLLRWQPLTVWIAVLLPIVTHYVDINNNSNIMSAIAREVAKSLSLPILARLPRTLYETLAKLPNYGISAKVVPLKYLERNYPVNSYYEITRVKMHPRIPSHGKAWGFFYWKGIKKNESSQKIRGGLKQRWVVIDRTHISASQKDPRAKTIVTTIATKS